MTQLSALTADTTVAETLLPLASEGGPHASLNAWGIGAGALAALLLLLWITTRLNRDR
ncbi:hypothetical protein RM844_30770 [Streptomyces sp. DSM 44915]|uniref:Uncharacterized protein n=1 Tax=Streptomyces chisholmiae TaxID=3075540 RepID=A0ABU2K1M5_9ACTN|nr:hypothetical protein [Streptomyces sp. DSM 44915]MDT0270664.1 hypothetical protein [Streptomyces sp. DSM 44915]